MNGPQANRFQSGRYEPLFRGWSSGLGQRGSSSPEAGQVLRQLWAMVQKLYVALKYQVYKCTGLTFRPMQLPWMKLAFITLTAYVAFEKEWTFTINMDGPPVQTQSAGFESPLPPQAVSTALPVDVELPPAKPASPFEALPTDDAKARRYKAYIRRFEKVALAEKKKFGIPASVKMAQALLESDAGQSPLARQTNNHFGMKCFSRRCSKDHCVNFGDDHHKDFFRRFNTPWESWRAHSLLIANGKYKSLLQYGDDYRKWAQGLSRLGYATDPRYPQKLINTIETYQLDWLDKHASPF